MRSLVLLFQGPKFYLVLLKALFYACFGRFGVGEGEGGVFGGGQQELVMLVMLVMFIVCQLGGVARCRRHDIVNAGLDVGEGESGSSCMQGRGHLRPKMGEVLHVEGGGARSGEWERWDGVPGNVLVPSPRPREGTELLRGKWWPSPGP